jgi:hypothetical protein
MDLHNDPDVLAQDPIHNHQVYEIPRTAHRSRWWWGWYWIPVVLLGSCLVGGSWFYLADRCTPSGAADLQALDALPETRLLPPQSASIARERSDGSCALESPYYVHIRMTVESELTAVNIRAFYIRAMKAQGWSYSWSAADEIHWYKGERVLAVYFLTVAPARPAGPMSPVRTRYFLDSAEWKRP